MKKNNKYVVIIPARSGSKGIKKKNIKDINGHPLIAYTIKAALESKEVSSVYVTTDNLKIAKISKKYGAKVIMRPAILAKDNSKIIGVLKHSIKYLSKESNINLENIVLLQPTSPLRNKNDLDKSIKKYEMSKSQMLFSSIEIDLCSWRKKGKKVRPLNFVSFFKRNMRQNSYKDIIENGSIYILNREFILNNSSKSRFRIESYPMKNYTLFEIDNIDEFNLIKAILKSNESIFENLIKFRQ